MRSKRLLRMFWLIVVAAAIGTTFAWLGVYVQEARAKAVQARRDGLDVPYVPTPQVVVDKMLEMAAVTKDDVVYDLGCGDGRIVVTAAKQFGARGLGVDIDPDRIKDSNANARKARVTD